jgi:2-polyprenyl-3-methyl-5-hydroxy-6-metoxy-1,4-benzoquinol methylase
MNNCQQYGQSLIIFSKYNGTFDHIFVCEKDEKIKNETISNLKQYQLDKFVTFFEMDLIDFLKNEYSKVTSKSIVFFQTEGLSEASGSDESNEIMKFVSSMESPPPLIFFNMFKFKEIENFKILKNEKINLIGFYKNMRIDNKMNHLSVQSKAQFKEILKNKKMKEVLFKFLKGKLFKDKSMMHDCLKLIEDLVKDKDDSVVYSELFKRINENSKVETVNEEGRVNWRVNEIEDLLKKNLKYTSFESMLDIGCGDGSISLDLGKALKIKNIHACDIRKIISTNDLNFKLLDENSKELPYEDESMSIVFCIMSLHHMKHLNETLNEIYRIVKPGSYLLIREHDCDEKNFDLFLDVH